MRSFLALTFVLLAASVARGTLTYTDDQRLLRLTLYPCLDCPPFVEEIHPDTAFAPWAYAFDEAGARAAQESTLGANAITLSVLAGTFPDGSSFEPLSIFEVSFTTDEVTAFHLSGARSAPAFVQLLEDGIVIADSGGAATFDLGGSLALGRTYTLRAQASADAIIGSPNESLASANFVVPEPGVAVLLSVGLLALTQARRPHRR